MKIGTNDIFTFLVRFFSPGIVMCLMILIGTNLFLFKKLPLYFVLIIFIFIIQIITYEKNPMTFTIYVMLASVFLGGILSKIVINIYTVQIFFLLLVISFLIVLFFLQMYLPIIKKIHLYKCLCYIFLIYFIFIDGLYINGLISRTETIILYLLLVLSAIHIINYTSFIIAKYAESYPNFLDGLASFIKVFPMSMKNITQLKIIDDNTI